MRWLSSVAILFYLSLLCTSQAFAVHDVRLSPLADTQLYAISATPPQSLLSTQQNLDDTPPVVLLPAALTVAHYDTSFVALNAVVPADSQFLTSPQARAPPLFSSR